MTLFPIPEDKDVWHVMRARHVGASEVAALFEAQAAYQLGPYALWAVKSGKAPRPVVDNERVEWGLLMEEAIALACHKRQGWDIAQGMYASHSCGLGATLDRILTVPDTGERAPLELKNVDWMVHRRSWDKEPPLHIQLQLQAQLLATGAPWGAVAALIGGNRLEIHIERARPAILAEMERRVTEFWRRVREDDPPEPDGSDSTFRALVAMHPELDAEPADLREDGEAVALAEEAVTAEEEAKAAKARACEARNRLLARIGPHRWAMVPGFRTRVKVVPDNPGRAAAEGEIVGARKGSRSLMIERMDS